MVDHFPKFHSSKFDQKLSSETTGRNVIKTSICQVLHTKIVCRSKFDLKYLLIFLFRDLSNERQIKNSLKEHIDKTTRKNAPTDEVNFWPKFGRNLCNFKIRDRLSPKVYKDKTAEDYSYVLIL
jgi:predicted nucleic acid-binding protein